MPEDPVDDAVPNNPRSTATFTLCLDSSNNLLLFFSFHTFIHFFPIESFERQRVVHLLCAMIIKRIDMECKEHELTYVKLIDNDYTLKMFERNLNAFHALQAYK